jgi:hypothetical protein
MKALVDEVLQKNKDLGRKVSNNFKGLSVINDAGEERGRASRTSDPSFHDIWAK